MNTWIRRAAVVGTVALGLAATGIAAARDTDHPPVVTGPERVQQLCQDRVPRVEDRIGRLIARIDAGPDVPGSAAWLRARAQEARDAGDTARAERLERRLERRDHRSTGLGNAQRRVDAFQAEHCGVR